MPTRFCAIALAGLVAASLACSTPRSASTPKVCAADARTTQLDVTLDPWILSQAFTVVPKTTTWVTVTTLPVEYDGLFGHINGVADLHSIPAGTSPTVGTGPDGIQESRDPDLVLQRDSWQMLSLNPGSWQAYTLEHHLGIKLVSCPLSG